MRVHQASGMITNTGSLGGQIARGAHNRTAAEGQDSPQAIVPAIPRRVPPAGSCSPSVARPDSVPTALAPPRGFFSPQAIHASTPILGPPAGTSFTLGGHTGSGTHSPPAVEGKDSRTARVPAVPKVQPPSGPSPPSGHPRGDAHGRTAAEGNSSPQAIPGAESTFAPPAGSKTAPPAKRVSMPKAAPPEGHQTSRSHALVDAHIADAAALNLPGGHYKRGPHDHRAAGASASLQAIHVAMPMEPAPAGNQASRGQRSTDAQ